jgi:hypothetical protein
MDWSLANLIQIATRAITHRSQIEEVARRSVDLLVQVEQLHGDLLNLVQRIAPELLTEMRAREARARGSDQSGIELH